MPQVYEFPPEELSFDNARDIWELSATENNTVSLVIAIDAPIAQGNQLDWRMFVDSFSGNDISVYHGTTDLIGQVNSAGDANGSQTAFGDAATVLITSEGPCNHVISSFTFDVNPD